MEVKSIWQTVNSGVTDWQALLVLLPEMLQSDSPEFLENVSAAFRELAAAAPLHNAEAVTGAITELSMARILPKVILLAIFYVISWIAIILQTQLMAVITQGFLCKLRRTMFDKMQNLPIRYFDT